MIACLILVTFKGGKRRAITKANQLGGTKHLNSLPFYYGMLAVFWCVIPCLFFVVAWSIFDDIIIKNLILSQLPEHLSGISDGETTLIVNLINNIASGVIPPAGQEQYLIDSANYLTSLHNNSNMALSVIAISVAICAVCILSLIHI